MQCKFYNLVQQHHAGKYILSPERGVGLNTIVMAYNSKSAVSRFRKLGINFDVQECQHCETPRFSTNYLWERNVPLMYREEMRNLDERPHRSFLHMKSGRCIDLCLHTDVQHNEGAVHEFLDLVSQGLIRLRTSQINQLKSITKRRKLPLHILPPLKEPSITGNNNFLIHDLAFEAHSLGLVPNMQTAIEAMHKESRLITNYRNAISNAKNKLTTPWVKPADVCTYSENVTTNYLDILAQAARRTEQF